MSVRLAPWSHATPVRRAIVACLGAGAVHRGVAYLVPPGSPYAPSPTGGVIEVLALGGPMWVLGVAWCLVGAYALVSAAVGRWVTATAAVGAIWLAWGLAYLVAALAPGWGQASDWISAGTYMWVAPVILLALLVREVPHVTRDEEG